MITDWSPDPLTPARAGTLCRRLAEAYPFLSYRCLGHSLLGREISLMLLGRGKSKVLYVGAHHGSEWLTAGLLLRFAEELCIAVSGAQKIFGIHIPYLLENRMLCIVPMLNPDGVAIAQGEIAEGDLLAERRLHMNPSGDFTHWQANARGVDLNHNYDAGFAAYKKIEAESGITGGAPTRYSGEYPESEPETAALCGFIRTAAPRLLLTLHTQGEEIYYAAPARVPGSRPIAMRLAALSGYRVAEADGAAAYGGLSDWAAASLGIPSFTLECGRGENPLPGSDMPLIYAELRRLFFESATM